MYTIVLHTVYVLKFQRFSAPRRSAQGVQCFRLLRLVYTY
jgi:hypothetical protein